MSFSVDDLVSSLSSNHIGQEAMDLATLQAQLAETLFGGPSSSTSSSYRERQSSTPTRGRMQHTQPCNTPLARTPSSSSSGLSHAWGMDATSHGHTHSTHGHGRGRTNSVSSTYLDETEEDERMVEDLLIPLSTPLSPANMSESHFSNGDGFSSSFAPSSALPSYNPNSKPNTYSDPMPSSPTTSHFTTTDPFYIAQLQASQQSQTQSVFAQNGRLGQNSPFALPTQYHQFHSHGHGQNQWDSVGAMNMNHPSKTCATAF